MSLRTASRPKKPQTEGGLADKYGPGSKGLHEATLTVVSLINDVHIELVNHPSIMLNAEWQRLATSAADTLMLLHERMGGRLIPTRGSLQGQKKKRTKR